MALTVIFVTITAVMSACSHKKEGKYKVLFAGASDSMSGLVYPVEIDLHHKKDTDRDEDMWPDEMSIVFDGQPYECFFDQVYRIGINTGYQYVVKNQNQDGKKGLICFTLNDNREIVLYFETGRMCYGITVPKAEKSRLFRGYPTPKSQKRMRKWFTHLLF